MTIPPGPARDRQIPHRGFLQPPPQLLAVDAAQSLAHVDRLAVDAIDPVEPLARRAVAAGRIARELAQFGAGDRLGMSDTGRRQTKQRQRDDERPPDHRGGGSVSSRGGSGCGGAGANPDDGCGACGGANPP